MEYVYVCMYVCMDGVCMICSMSCVGVCIEIKRLGGGWGWSMGCYSLCTSIREWCYL